MERPYAKDLGQLWEKSRNGTLLNTDVIWQDLRSKTNMPDLQRELDQMTVKYV